MVSSVNTNQQVQYERKFSPAKALTSAAVGAAGLKVFNDSMLRKNAMNTVSIPRGANADEFISAAKMTKSGVEQTMKTAQEVLKNTDYLYTLKNAVKHPADTVSKAAKTVKNTKPGDVLSAVKGTLGKTASTIKSLKGATAKETLTKVSKALKTVKGRNVLTIATGAVCGLMLFGSSKRVEAQPKNQA